MADLHFLLEDVLHIEDLFTLPDFAHADTEVAQAVLREGARFAEQKLAPANEISDLEGARLEDGRVLLPKIFHQATRAKTLRLTRRRQIPETPKRTLKRRPE